MVKKTRNKSRVKDFLDKYDRYIRQRKVVKYQVMRSDSSIEINNLTQLFVKTYESPMTKALEKLTSKEKEKCKRLINEKNL